MAPRNHRNYASRHPTGPAEHKVATRYVAKSGMAKTELVRVSIATMIRVENAASSVEWNEWTLEFKCRSLLNQIEATPGTIKSKPKRF